MEGLSGALAGGTVVVIALLFAIVIVASAAAFFCVSQASRVLSATNLPTATRLRSFAGFVVGVGVVACCVITGGKGASWLSPCVCVLSACLVDILQCVCEEKKNCQ